MISTPAPTPLASPAGVKDAEGSLAKLEGQHDLVSAIKLYIKYSNGSARAVPYVVHAIR